MDAPSTTDSVAAYSVDDVVHWLTNETRDERLLIPGVGFSIEPGIYVPGKIGMRTEVNVFLRPGEAVVTPRAYQSDLIEV